MAAEEYDATATVEVYQRVGADGDSSDEPEANAGGAEAARSRAYQKLSVDMDAHWQDLEKNDDLQDADRGGDYHPGLLGTEEDKAFLSGMMERFARDDLKQDDDALEAAIRMQIQTVTAFNKCIFTVLSCGLWMLYHPPEDTSVCILTKKGRLIVYGKKQASNPNRVGGFVVRVAGFTLLCAIVCVLYQLLASNGGIPLDDLIQFVDGDKVMRIAGTICAILGMLWLFSQRPRPDCGSSYRQHFEVRDICCAVYAREDFGGCFGRRKAGHLRLCFSRIYPDETSLGSGLPTSSPHTGAVGPCLALPAAMAGEKAEVLREEAHAEEEKANRSPEMRSVIGPKTATVLAILATLGAMHEYLTMMTDAIHERQICTEKVKGCSWRVDNSPFLGKLARVEDGLVPKDPQAANCTSSNSYCDVFWRPLDFCMPDTARKGRASFQISCDKLPKVFNALSKTKVDVMHRSNANVKYVVSEPVYVDVVPSASYPYGHSKLVEKGMVLTAITGNVPDQIPQSVASQLSINFTQVTEECEKSSTRSLHLVLEQQADTVPLFEEDCQELQQACEAATFSPETFGWWPPSRWIVSRYPRTTCNYVAMTVWLSNGGQNVWQDLSGMDAAGNGFGCHGTPLQSIGVAGLEACEIACKEREGCNYIFFGSQPADRKHTCILYGACRARQQGKLESKFHDVTCGEALPAGYPSSAVRNVWVKSGILNVDSCRQHCEDAASRNVQCNAFAYNSMPTGAGVTVATCALYGPTLFHVDGSWVKPAIHPESIGKTGVGGSCFLRNMPVPASRKPMGVPGHLFRWSSVLSCAGCVPRSVLRYYLEFPNFVTLLTQVIGIIAFIQVAQHASRLPPSALSFEGKPEINLQIMRNPANLGGFDEREKAYLCFLQRCWSVAAELRGTASKESDVWEQEECDDITEKTHVDVDVRCTDCQDYDTYDLVNSMRDTVYVDKRLLAIPEEEKVLSAWSESTRHSFAGLILLGIGYVIGVSLMFSFFPEVTSWPPFRFVLTFILPAAYLVHSFFKLRAEVQCLCLTTSHGRVIQLSRQPATGLGWLMPHFYGGTDVRLDSFYVGKAMYVQLDMPLTPLWKDWIRSCRRPPFRRGVVTMRGEHGMLQVRRTNGEALVAHRALAAMIHAPKSSGMKVACLGNADIFGITSADLLSEEEQLIWEWKLSSCSIFADPFEYTSLISISDSQLHVTRSRCPKPFSARGLFCGPFTLGHRCRQLHEFMGYNAGLTVTSLGHVSLESYATSRSRAPPFWPGVGPAIDSFGVMFMPKFSQVYPASLSICKKPYGLARSVTLDEDHGVHLAHSKEQSLRIVRSSQLTAPKGARVASVLDPDDEEIAIDDERWQAPGGYSPSAGAKLFLESVDHQWNDIADEPWMAQLRGILSIILRREDAAAADDDLWDILEQEDSNSVSFLARIGAMIFGNDMMGIASRPNYRHLAEDGRSDSSEESSAEDGARGPFQSGGSKGAGRSWS